MAWRIMKNNGALFEYSEPQTHLVTHNSDFVHKSSSSYILHSLDDGLTSCKQIRPNFSAKFPEVISNRYQPEFLAVIWTFEDK